MVYYVSYIVKKSGSPRGHSSLMLSEHHPPEFPKVIGQYGMYGEKLKWYRGYFNKIKAIFEPEKTVEMILGASNPSIYHKT